jgi:hypothetical protein
MGVFIHMSCVSGKGQSDSLDALRAYAQSQNGVMGPSERFDPRDGELGLAAERGGNASILYPHMFDEWEGASSFISARLRAPVLSLHIHDGDLWMYTLYEDGAEVDWFMTVPRYWEEQYEADPQKWRGRPDIVARLFPQTQRDAIAAYLVDWDDVSPDDKARPDDEHGFGDVWQVLDFMALLGFAYPMDDDGKPTGEVFRLKLPPFSERARRG